MDWSKNPFWDTLNTVLKTSNLQYLLFVFPLSNSSLITLRSIFDLNVICSQSCGHLEAFGLLISPKTRSQQPCFWRSMKKKTLYLYLFVRKKELKGILNWCVTTSCIILGLTCVVCKLLSEADVKSPFSRHRRTEVFTGSRLTANWALSSLLSAVSRTDSPSCLMTPAPAHRVWMKYSKHRHLVSTQWAQRLHNARWSA